LSVSGAKGLISACVSIQKDKAPLIDGAKVINFLYFQPKCHFCVNIVLFVVFRRDTAAVFVNEAQVEVKHFGDLSLQLGLTIDEVVLEIKHRRLIEGKMYQIEIVG
jgi:hypothetical protein